MFDKVKLFLPKSRTPTPDVTSFLNNPETRIDVETGEEKATSGYCGTMSVESWASGLSIRGSLAKFMNGANIYPLNKRTTREAIEKLSDSLHLDVGAALVTGLEFGTTFPMQEPPEMYFRRLIEHQRLKRMCLGDTLYFTSGAKNQPKKIAFYDKAKEMQRSGTPTPIEANLLRYELRLNGRLNSVMKEPTVTASTLSESRFYQKLIRLWQDEYFKIRKQANINTDEMEQIKKPKDALDMLFAKLIAGSDPKVISNFLEELKQAKVVDRQSLYKLKKQIQVIAAKVCTDEADELIKELDNDIRNAGAYL